MKNTIGNFYKKIVIRHLTWERPDTALDVLERFVNEVQGAKYSFKLSQLRKRNTVNLGRKNRPIASDGPSVGNSTEEP